MSDTEVKKVCFVISPIGDAGTPTRKRADQVLKHIIAPVCEAAGYVPVRADKISKSGSITSQIIGEILEAPLVIADLTEHNPNVFYELALRHAIRKPYIQLAEKGERLPFDIANLRTVIVDTSDLDSVEEARKEITEQIRHFEEHPDQVDSPISTAVDQQTLRGSADPERRSIAEIVSAIAELRNLVEDLPQHIARDAWISQIRLQPQASRPDLLVASPPYARGTKKMREAFVEYLRHFQDETQPGVRPDFTDGQEPGVPPKRSENDAE